jgi:uncharacterized protein (TIGR02145 family)
MKSILVIFITLSLTTNIAIAQDTIYVYQGGSVLYKRAITNVDSVSFSKVYPLSTTAFDIEGNSYRTVTIGTQTWMAENLKTTKYRNGDAIVNETSGTVWILLTSGAWCNYDNNAANGLKYGKLYNWYAVNDPRNIAPAGWHVATDAEWTTLTNYVAANLGTSISVPKALATTIDWITTSADGGIGCNLSLNNYSGFSALPGGCRGDVNGVFFNAEGLALWWTSTPHDTHYAFARHLTYNLSTVGSYAFDPLYTGRSVRCVKDSY